MMKLISLTMEHKMSYLGVLLFISSLAVITVCCGGPGDSGGSEYSGGTEKYSSTTGTASFYYASPEGLQVIKSLMTANPMGSWYEGSRCRNYASDEVAYMFPIITAEEAVRQRINNPGSLKACVVGKDSDSELKNEAIRQNGNQVPACDPGFTGCWVVI